ncbi:peptide-methionine (S)-S-oxide reductase MsrA [Kriegella aquimaris]|uniref:Peptide methionine sulfoxide reductase MsrA n=1 Tax=Kriegella aquimaris TaxID=192904 RepID=A0A1G9YC39_9FLAO|nr:peptide-methionine (S)-S-oxide reductase MsrA [Kriegella aquimaris]SDN06662.1 peptide-methionine (S)-S-oxide reductase [Kriegella aquimaris]
MLRIQIPILILTLLFATGCQSNTKKNGDNNVAEVTSEITKETIKLAPQDLAKYETAYFASGCFWCVEAIFESVKGVKEAVSGYAGGTEKNPTYEQVGRGLTSHAEAVEVYYDPKEITFIELVQVFFGSHDPTSLNRQGPDRGPQYRSIAFYKNEEEKKIIDTYIAALKEQHIYDAPIVTEVTKFTKFYDAEDYHQDYEKRNPDNSYIRNVSIPRLNRFKQNFPEYLKKEAH